MADSPAFQSATPATLPAGVAVSTEEISTLNGGAVAAQHVQRFLAAFRTADGVAVDLPGDAANGLDVDVTRVQGTVAVSGPLTDAQLRATPVPVSGSVTVSDGSGPVTVDGTVSVGNFPATQPVSAASLPLPTGAASDAGLAAILSELGQKVEPGDLAGLATAAKQDTLAAKDFATQATLAALLADSQAKADLSETQPVSAAALPLPSGAASSAKQDTAQTRLDLLSTEATLALIKAKTDNIDVALSTRTKPADTQKVDGSAVTQPVSGTVSVNALPAGANNIGQVDPRGNVAHDGADSGNPVKTGGRARTALPAAVAQDDRSDTITDKHGRTLVANSPVDQRTSGRANYTNTTAADVIAAPGASVILVVTTLLVTNAHATVGTKVEIRDGTTVKLIGQASKDGGGFNLHDPDGLFVATSNTAVTARCVTTGADVEVFVAGFKIPG